MKPILEVKDLQKSFFYPQKVELFKKLNFSLPEATSVALVGASGEGKTTLLHILGGLETKDAGQIFFKGVSADLFSIYDIRRKKVGFIFQGFHLIEDFSVIENLLLPKKIMKEDTSKDSPSYQLALSYLEEVGLKDRAFFAARLLSGGEKQRLAIIRSLMNDPELILADEPSGNLDHNTSQIIQKLLLSLVKKRKKTLLIATHDQKFASLCDQIYQLEDGNISKIH